MNDFPRYGNNSGRKRRYDESSVSESCTGQGTGCVASQAEIWASITPFQLGTGNTFMPSLELPGEWGTQQMSITDCGSWQDPQLLPDTPTVQGYPAQPPTLPFDQQYTLPSVDVVPESFGPPLFNYSNMMYSAISLNQQYGAPNVPEFRQSTSYGIAPIQGNSPYQQEQGAIISAENFQVPHSTIAPSVHDLTSDVDPYVYLTSLKVYPINRRKHRPLSMYTEPTRT